MKRDEEEEEEDEASPVAIGSTSANANVLKVSASAAATEEELVALLPRASAALATMAPVTAESENCFCWERAAAPERAADGGFPPAAEVGGCEWCPLRTHL